MFVLALTGSVRFIGRAPGVLIGVLRGLLWSSPKAGAEGLPVGIVRALDPCSCGCMHVCEYVVLWEAAPVCCACAGCSVFGNAFESECGKHMRLVRFVR